MEKSKLLFSILVFVLIVHNACAQNQNTGVDLISSYENYTEMDREVVYAHLNKSVYIKGETIGLKAYVFDKYTSTLVHQASNLYCTISNDQGRIIDSKLFMIIDGTAVGDFEINDAYKSGYYTIKIYTNWMRNFDEQNLFVETIRIIDLGDQEQLSTETEVNTIDAQFLPEGGHLLSGVENTVGIVIKNSQGLGVSDIEGEIVDQDAVVITNFKVNQFGIGKCLLTPKQGNQYTAKFKYADTIQNVNIKGLKSNGIAMRLLPLRAQVALTVKTNTATWEQINQNIYKLAIHNGEDLKEISFKFGDQTEIVKVIPLEDLFQGINIFTIFDTNNNPLLERLYFNYEGLKIQSSENYASAVQNDSVTISLPYKTATISTKSDLSVSVLPMGTITVYHQSIMSSVLLQPYVKGFIERANYYFTEITPKKQFELDNLLITQGWSSYNWQTIFNSPPEYDFDAENGISYTLNLSEKKDKQYMIYPSLNHATKLISLSKDNSSYTASGLFLVENETIKIREIGAVDKQIKPSLYIQFDPIKIPELQSKIAPLTGQKLYNEATFADVSLTTSLKKVEYLDEIFISEKKKYTEIEKLQNRSLGSVEAIDDDLVKRYRTLVRYLRDKGWTVADTPGKFEIYNNAVNSTRDRVVLNVAESSASAVANSDPDGPAAHLVRTGQSLTDNASYDQSSSTMPIVYLDDMILHQDLTILKNLTLDQIEWVEINKSGVGGGMRSGAAGLIRIKTRPHSNVKVKEQSAYSTYEIPLKFSVAKKFYVPEYVSYSSTFFNKFGIIDWFPSAKLNTYGALEFKIADKNVKEFKIFIEGVIDKTFVSEVKTIHLN